MTGVGLADDEGMSDGCGREGDGHVAKGDSSEDEDKDGDEKASTCGWSYDLRGRVTGIRGWQVDVLLPVASPRSQDADGVEERHSDAVLETETLLKRQDGV